MKELIVLVAVPVFFGLILLEFALGSRRGRSDYTLPDTACSLSIGMLGQVTGAFSGAIGIAIYGWLSAHVAPVAWPLDAWWTWVAATVLFDLGFYWGHRLSHVVNLAWAAHVVHHSSEAYNLSTALRQPSFNFLFSWLVYAPMAAAGIPPLAFAVAAGVNLVYQFWPHTRLVGRLGWFDRWFASPSNHRVHHGRNDWCIDRNFGGVLMVWDRLFGTFVEERDGDPVVFGIREPLGSYDPYRANLHHFEALWRDLRRARSWRDRVLVLFGHPGGRLHEACPAMERGPRLPQPAPTSPARRVYAIAQLVMCLAATVHFMAVNARLPFHAAVAYAAAIGVSLVVLRRVVEGGRGALPAELARLCALGVALASAVR